MMQTCNIGCARWQLVHNSNCLLVGTGKTYASSFRRQSAANRALLRAALRTKRRKSTRAFNTRGSAWATSELDRDAAKEESRPHKRTVFTFRNWAAHRSSKRYNRHIKSLLRSRIFRALLPSLLIVTTISTAIAVYETLLELGYLPDEWPGLTIEATAPLSLTSFALSLLLVFRTNSSYARWQEARNIWGGITNRSRDIVQQALTFVPGNEPELVEMFKRWSIAYSKALMCHLRDDHDVKDELQGVLQPHELDILLATAHKPNYILQVLRGLVESSCIVSPERFRMDQNITFFMDAQGACERILRTPIPLSYTRHTSRFLVIWLSLMPFTLWKSCHWAIIPVSAIVAFLLLGIEEIGVQIEEPFGILALEVMCDTIETDLVEMVKNDLTVRQLIGSVNNQGATRIRLENEQDRTKRVSSPNHTDDFLRDNSGNGAREDFFATPDMPGGEHR